MLKGAMVSRIQRALSVLGLSVMMLLYAPLAGAGEEYPAPGFFLDGLTADSSWPDILAKPGIRADLPFVGFEATYVPLESVCVDGPMLEIANPRLDTGVRVSAEELRAQFGVAAAAGGHSGEPAVSSPARRRPVRRSGWPCVTP